MHNNFIDVNSVIVVDKMLGKFRYYVILIGTYLEIIIYECHYHSLHINNVIMQVNNRLENYQMRNN